MERRKRKRDDKNMWTEILDEYKCLLTSELPVDPVIAEDGHVYERAAIEEYSAKHASDLKSPVTNEPMGRYFASYLHGRRIIEIIVRSGSVDSDDVMRWSKRSKQDEDAKRKMVVALRQQSERGDVNAMHDLAICYRDGRGVSKDDFAAYSWFKKAADSDDVRGTAMAGWHLLNGEGVDENHLLAMVLLGRAEEAGSDVAAYLLGEGFCLGYHGLPKDPVQGKKMLSKVVDGTCRFKHLEKMGFLDEARTILQELDVPPVTDQS